MHIERQEKERQAATGRGRQPGARQQRGAVLSPGRRGDGGLGTSRSPASVLLLGA